MGTLIKAVVSAIVELVLALLAKSGKCPDCGE